MEEIDRVLLKMHHKARREVINELMKEYKGDSTILKKLKEMLKKEREVLNKFL